MEPIPEDPESPARLLETKSVLREIYRSEKVENIQKRVPVTYFADGTIVETGEAAETIINLSSSSNNNDPTSNNSQQPSPHQSNNQQQQQQQQQPSPRQSSTSPAGERFDESSAGFPGGSSPFQQQQQQEQDQHQQTTERLTENKMEYGEGGEVKGTSYSYSYESSYDQPPQTTVISNGEHYDPDAGDYAYETHSTSRQKVTRLTKVTTTRTVEEVTADSPNHTELLNSSGGGGATEVQQFTSHQQQPQQQQQQQLYDFPPSSNSPSFSTPVEADNSYNNNASHLNQHQQNGSIPLIVNNGNSQQHSPYSSSTTTGTVDTPTNQYALPSPPGVPQPVEIEATEVRLVWLRPDKDGDAGGVIGYQVQFRSTHPTVTPWRPAHSDTIPDTQCTDYYVYGAYVLLLTERKMIRIENKTVITVDDTNIQYFQGIEVSNLEANGEYQFRVVAKNVAGFGGPSTPSPPIQLRASIGSGGSVGGGSGGNGTVAGGISTNQKTNQEPLVPYPPGRPLVNVMDGSSVGLAWEPPIFCGRGGPIMGYQVEYRPVTEPTWLMANDQLVADTTCTVSGLRPNGEYEFRIMAKNCEGWSEGSQTSGMVRIRPMAPPRSPNTTGGHLIQQPPQHQLPPAHIPPHPHPALGHQPPMRPPLPPSQPQVGETDSENVMLMWGIVEGEEGRVAGYVVEQRKIGEVHWQPSTSHPIPTNRFNVGQLHPNATYEFRVLAQGVDGQLSFPSEVSELVQLRPRLDGGQLRGVPGRPQPPEIMEHITDQVTLCWMPTHSTLPIQGYDMEFRDLTESPNWFKLNDLLMQNCRMTIGDLMLGHKYEFRVIAKNAMGYSEPSHPSISIVVGTDYTTSSPTPTATPSNNRQQSQQQQQPNRRSIADEFPPRGAGRRISGPGVGGIMSDVDAEDNNAGVVPPPMPLTTASNGGGGGTLQREISYISDKLDNELIRESPPLPDRDDSPPPIHRPPFKSKEGENVSWRDPTLPEVLEYLSSPNNVIRLNAAGYLQHLTYHDNEMKKLTRELGGIERLIDLLSSEIPEIQKNACGCLRNLAFGKENEENKRAIAGHGGIAALTALLKKTPDMQVKEEITGALWNLSSSDDLKGPIMDQSLDALVSQVIVPGSGWSPSGTFNDPRLTYNPNVFRNATGLLRNMSALGERSRRALREAPDLVDALLHFLDQAIKREDSNSKTVENVVCVLRNMSYRCQEVEDPNYDKHPPGSARDSARSKSAPSGSPKVKPKKESKLFGKKKSKEDAERRLREAEENGAQQARGMAQLWQPRVVNLYLTLLSTSSNPEILEAAAGAIQNLSACYWQPSIDIRAKVRREKGLPTFVELLSHMDIDRVLCAVATAMRNLALDPANRDLIGRYAMKDLSSRLPPAGQPPRSSNETITAILGVVYETTLRSSAFTQAFHENGGTDKLVSITRQPQSYSPKVVRYASQVLHCMYEHRELYNMFKKSGFKETDFIVRNRPGGAGGGPGDSATLARPVSTQGQERSRLRPDLNDSIPSTSRTPPSPAHSQHQQQQQQQQEGYQMQQRPSTKNPYQRHQQQQNSGPGPDLYSNPNQPMNSSVVPRHQQQQHPGRAGVGHNTVQYNHHHQNHHPLGNVNNHQNHHPHGNVNNHQNHHPHGNVNNHQNHHPQQQQQQHSNNMNGGRTTITSSSSTNHHPNINNGVGSYVNDYNNTSVHHHKNNGRPSATEPLYAQVQKRHSNEPPQHSLYSNGGAASNNGPNDSWV